MIYLEVEPIVKTVLFRCLVSELVIPEEILTFAPDQQALALSLVSRLGGTLVEGGNLSKVDPVCVRSSEITKFTQRDYAIWDCIVIEPAPKYWAVQERDNELARLKMEVSTLQIEKCILEDESIYYSRRCARLVGALEGVTMERDSIRNQLETGGDGLVSWSEWETMRRELGEKGQCISQLQAKLAKYE
jgi:hypothetical protein